MDHSVRMVIIPEDIYLSLLNQNKTLSNPVDSHILESSNKINNILHDATLDDSTKFKLYSNELKRIQNIRANREEVPANVNIKNIDSGAAEEISKAVVNKISDEKELHDLVKRNKEKSSTEESYSTGSLEGIEEEFVTPKKASSLSISPRVIRNEKYEELRNYLNQNRQKFGIREDGRIFKDTDKRSVYLNSNFDKIAKALAGLTPRRPQGLRKLLSEIEEDDYAKNLILDFKSSQKGKGHSNVISVQNIKDQKRSLQLKCPTNKGTKIMRYCPEIWNHC